MKNYWKMTSELLCQNTLSLSYWDYLCCSELVPMFSLLHLKVSWCERVNVATLVITKEKTENLVYSVRHIRVKSAISTSLKGSNFQLLKCRIEQFSNWVVQDSLRAHTFDLCSFQFLTLIVVFDRHKVIQTSFITYLANRSWKMRGYYYFFMIHRQILFFMLLWI